MTKQILAFLFYFKRELNPLLPPYPHPNLRARTQTLYSPLTSIPKPSPLHPSLNPHPSAKSILNNLWC